MLEFRIHSCGPSVENSEKTTLLELVTVDIESVCDVYLTAMSKTGSAEPSPINFA
jgi:hypothetical protein